MVSLTFLFLALLPLVLWTAGSSQGLIFEADLLTRTLNQHSSTHNEMESKVSAVKQKVCIIGSGNWGSCVAKIIGENVQTLLTSQEFEPQVNMWIYEEKLESGELLSEVINSRHENVKYLPGIKLPENVVAVTNLTDAVKDATLLVFVVPHQFVNRICRQLADCRTFHSSAQAISLIKGLGDMSSSPDSSLALVSQQIQSLLGIDVSVLMGANIANDIALEKFSEATIGSQSQAQAAVWKKIFQAPYFRIRTVEDAIGVELCGALKNIIAVAAGINDGLGAGDNSKAAIIRRGLQEMKSFISLADSTAKCDETMWESCGVADTIASCYGGRNRRVAEAFTKVRLAEGDVPKNEHLLEELEHQLLAGQKLQGPPTAINAVAWLRERGMLEKFPLIHTVWRICYEQRDVRSFFEDIIAADEFEE